MPFLGSRQIDEASPAAGSPFRLRSFGRFSATAITAGARCSGYSISAFSLFNPSRSRQPQALALRLSRAPLYFSSFIGGSSCWRGPARSSMSVAWCCWEFSSSLQPGWLHVFHLRGGHASLHGRYARSRPSLAWPTVAAVAATRRSFLLHISGWELFWAAGFSRVHRRGQHLLSPSATE